MKHALAAPICLIALGHIAGGAIVLVAPQAAKVSNLAGLMEVPGMTPDWAAGALIVVGVMALWGRLGNAHRLVRHGLIIPQQAMLMFQFLGMLGPMMYGTYPDGYVPVEGNKLASMLFILEDQLPLTFMAFSHLLEMVVADISGNRMERLRSELEDVRCELAVVNGHLAQGTEWTMWGDLVDSMDLGKKTRRNEHPVAERIEG